MYLYVFVDALAHAQGETRLMVNVSEMQRVLVSSPAQTSAHGLKPNV
jgi:hypothetical protein